MSDIESDPLTSALSTRRIPHSRSQAKGRGKGKGKSTSSNSSFDPLRTMGYYEVHLGSSAKRARKHDGAREETSSWLEIHELTAGEDGLLGTFRFDVRDGDRQRMVEGMCVLAGSRKGLSGIVDSLEKERNSADEDENSGSDDHDDHDDDNESEEEINSLEASDARLNHRHAAFEKNSFRNPKFWFRWKGHVHGHTSHIFSPTSSPADSIEEFDHARVTTTDSNVGYLVFTNNACGKFEGAVSCSRLGWDNLKMNGWKTRSRGTPSLMKWTEI